MVRKRWIVLVAMSVSNLCYGSMYVWSIFNQPLIEVTGLPISKVSLAYTLMMVITFLFTLFSSPLLRRLGYRNVMLLSALFWCAGWFFTGFARSAGQLYLFFSLLVGIGAGLGYNTIVSLIPLWFPDKKGLANGIAIGASGIAPLITAPIAYDILERSNVFTSFRVLSLLFAILLFGSFWLISAPAPDGPHGHNIPITPTDAATGVTTKQMLRDPVFYLFWFVLLAADTSGMMMTGHAANIGAEQVGLSAQSGTMLVGLLAVMNFAGRFVLGMLSDRIGRFRVVSAILILIAAAMLFMGYTDQIWQFLVLFSIVGLCFGAVMAVFPAICSDCFGSKHMASNWPVLYSGYTAASFVGPFSAATCFEQTGRYHSAFLLAGGLAVAALGFFLAANAILKKRSRNGSTQHSAAIEREGGGDQG